MTAYSNGYLFYWGRDGGTLPDKQRREFRSDRIANGHRLVTLPKVTHPRVPENPGRPTMRHERAIQVIAFVNRRQADWPSWKGGVR